MLRIYVGSTDMEGIKVGSMDGLTLLLGSSVGEIDGLIDIDNDGPELGPPVGNIRTNGSALGYDEGPPLTLGVKLGEPPGSIDSDGISVGKIEGDELVEGSVLGPLLGI